MNLPTPRAHRRLPLLAAALAAIAGTVATLAPPADAGVVHPITFPIEPGSTYRYSDDFGAPRSGHTHAGNDIMAAKLVKIVSAQTGVVSTVRVGTTATAGNYLVVTGDDGWRTWYIHLNNDSPGTDDGANPPQWRFAPGIAQGVRVRAGQFLGYVGDSGNAEATAPHLHFELRDPNGTAIDPYPSLQAAEQRMKQAATTTTTTAPPSERWNDRPVRGEPS